MKRLQQMSARTTVLSAASAGRASAFGRRAYQGRPQMLSADDAVKVIKTGDRVFVHSVAAAPQALIHAMTRRAPELRDVEVCHMHIEGDASYADKKYEGSFKNNNFFVGKNVRKGVQEGRLDYTPVFLSEIPLLFRRGILPLDVALITVSPPDQHGFCSLGTSVDASLAAVQCAKTVIAQVNPHMPRTHGDGFVHESAISFMVDGPAPLIEHKRGKVTETIGKIGKNVAQLVEDGATLQMGIGVIPDAVLAELTHHKKLGIHTEMFSDGIIDLVERGVITGENKVIAPRTITVGFCLGTKRLYDFVHENPAVQFRAIEWVNNPILIKENPKMTAINSAVEVDLSGQICADSIGSKLYSGVGGQMDFMRGAALSHGGKPIIALPSTTSRGESKIVPRLKRGAGVVTTRAHVHWVVTEWGAVNLFGKPVKERMKALISIAHPLHRPWLEKEVERGFWFDVDENSPKIPESAHVDE
uniref:ASCT1B n=1 Tax=Acanthamoeba castellanii TaxID=5755 RepID=A0A090XA21_ACACA